jgi:BolA family transcriptional regulator, general stress-responsive regulator
MTTVENSMRAALEAALKPKRLVIDNDSHRHAGHRSSPGTGNSHFTVTVVADAFAGKSRVERHRLVNAALDAHLKGVVHALAIRALSPDEDK